MAAQRHRIASVRAGQRELWGLVREDGFVDLGSRNPQYPTVRSAIEAGKLQALADAGAGHGANLAPGTFSYQIPVPVPQKIICIGINYPARNEEYSDGNAAAKYPGIFPRFPQSFVGHGENIMRPPESEQLDYEGELTLVIGKAGRRISRENALSHIAGVTLANEGTIRDWLRHSRFNVTQGKNFDRSGAIGPWIVPYENEAQIGDIMLTTRINGEVRQQDRTGRMIYDFRFIISYLSQFTTLQPGDIILTGTPVGTGVSANPPVWLKAGDIIEIEAEGVGMLRNAVANEAAV
ncbi:MAG: fumarylacetoacetate hydrolase family protein [Alphaproteobacteria bacterium]|nr:fumarylacetoacetate hydrolase family protein [Alphaproteobacteria bacterium]